MDTREFGRTPSAAATTPAQLGAALRSARLVAGLTQDALATRAGTTQRVISQLENAPDGRTLATLFRVLAALELELHLGPRPGDPVETDPDAW